MVAHRHLGEVAVLVVGGQVLGRHRPGRGGEVGAVDQAPARAGADGVPLGLRLEVEVGVEVRPVVDAGRRVPHRVPVQQHPAQRHAGEVQQGPGQGEDALVAGRALGRRVGVPVAVDVVAVVAVGHRGGQVPQGRVRVQHADGQRTPAVQLRVRPHQAVAQALRPAEGRARALPHEARDAGDQVGGGGGGRGDRQGRGGRHRADRQGQPETGSQKSRCHGAASRDGIPGGCCRRIPREPAAGLRMSRRVTLMALLVSAAWTIG